MSGRFSDLVVIIPGLTGSVLCKDGTPIWGYSPGALWRLKTGAALKTLELSGPDDGADDLGDGIVPTAPVSDVQITPGLLKLDGYSILMNYLLDNLSLEDGYNYRVFPYDWRRDNRVSARKLSNLVPQWLREWRAESGNANAKVVFVVHSMGGLVARYFVECLEGWKVTRSLISVGTPYRGSGNALGFLTNGFIQKAGPLRLFDGTAALRSFQSVYQLLPTYGFIETSDGEYARVCDVAVPNVDQERAKAAFVFHEEIRLAHEANSKLEGYQRNTPKVRPVVGTEQPTVLAARFDAAGAIELMNSRAGKDLKGDGTVPRISAVPAELPQDVATFVSNLHAALHSTRAAMDHIHGVLTGFEITESDLRANARNGTIGLTVADAYRAGGDIQLKAEASTYEQTLSARIVRLDENAEPVEATMTYDKNRHVAQANLPSGYYRIEVSGKRNQAVSDVFLVVDE